MEYMLLVLGCAFFVGMVISAFLHVWFFKFDSLQDNFLASIFAVTISSVIGIVAVSLFFWNDDDFITYFNYFQYLAPLCCALLLLPVLFTFDGIVVINSVLLVSFIGVYLSDIVITFSTDFPLWLNMFFTSVVWSLFALSFYCLSGLNVFPQSQGMLPSLGFVVLVILGGAPLIMGASAAVLVGVLLIACLRCKIQPMEHLGTIVLGYIVGWIGLVSYPEKLFSCFVIFTMYCLMEAALAVFRKCTTLPKYVEIPYNSTLYNAFEEGGAELVLKNICLIGGCLILFGVLQIYSSKDSSLTLFALMLCAWQQYRTINWQVPDKSFREINGETIKSLKSIFVFLSNKSNKKKHTDDK